MRFDELFSKRLQNMPRFVKKHEKSSIWPKLATFRKNYHVWRFDEVFSKKLEKVPHFVRKHDKSSIWSKLCNFGNKLPCLCISMNFSEKSCKKCLVSSKSTNNHRFGQSSATFRANYHVLAFRWSFQEKYANSASFREKAREIIDFNKTWNFFVRTSMSLHFDEVFRKKLQKLPHFLKKHEKSSIWPKLTTSRTNYHVSAFWSAFQQKVAKSGSFLEKERKIIDLAKSCNFSSKLPCFCVLVNFSAKRWKKWLISWKVTKNHRFGLSLQLFEETTMFRRFCQLFSKKLQKVAHFVKEHKKSSIWPKPATSRANYHVSAFWWTFAQKVSHFVKKNEKSSI